MLHRWRRRGMNACTTVGQWPHDAGGWKNGGRRGPVLACAAEGCATLGGPRRRRRRHGLDRRVRRPGRDPGRACARLLAGGGADRPVADAPVERRPFAKGRGADASAVCRPAHRGAHRADHPPSPSPGTDGVRGRDALDGCSEWSLVADVQVGFWAMGNGRLGRLDATGAMTASWTVADDEVFGAWGIAPAREGGVWLWGGPSIAWFDGKSFRDVIAAPSQGSGASWVVDVAEAPDGSLWAALGEDPAISGGRVMHWDGAAWTDACRPWPFVEIAQLAVDDAGGVWVAPTLANQDIDLFDGTTWSTPPSDPA